MSPGAAPPDRVRRAAGRSRLLRAGAVAAAVLAVALPAAGDTPSASDGSRDSAEATSKIPPIGGGDVFQDKGFRVQQTTADVSKAKVHFIFPDVYFRLYFVACFTNPSLETYNGDETPDGATTKECVKRLSPLPLPPKYQDPANGQLTLLGGGGDGYVVSRAGGRDGENTYGTFPPVKVRALVFGSIPVSATVRLEQTSTRGYLNPIRAKNANVQGMRAGAFAYPGFGRAPATAGDGDAAEHLTFTNSIDATLRLRLSDVAVDGRPVEVGSRCGTVSPVRLTVRGALGYWYEGSPGARTRGTPGGFLPLSEVEGQPPGYFDGNADVPAFAHCGSPTEDLDPLLTALVSSPTNRVTAFVPEGINKVDFCGSAVADKSCTPAVVASQRRMKALSTALLAHKSPATIRKLQAKLKASDFVMPRVKANEDS